ncbi:hypothetical protein ACWD6P_36905 [Streptomyces sp. NPDC002446]
MSDETPNEATNETEPAAPDAVVDAPPAAEDLSAEVEQLRAQLAEYVPIVQAHQEPEEARKTEEQHLREQVEAVQRELGEARRGLLLTRSRLLGLLLSALVSKRRREMRIHVY